MPAITLLDDPVQVTGWTAGSWTTVDVSSYVPVGTIAVIVEVQVRTGSTSTTDVRHPSSTRTGWTLTRYTGRTAWAKVNTSRQFQVYLTATAARCWLLGYVDSSDWVFSDEYANLGSNTASATWETASIATQTGTDTATAAVIASVGAYASPAYHGVRPVGATTGWPSSGSYFKHTLLPLNANEEYQRISSNTASVFHLVGYYKGSGITFVTNGTWDISPTLNNTWEDRTVPTGASWVAHNMNDPNWTDTANGTGHRRDGSTTNEFNTLSNGYRQSFTRVFNNVIELYGPNWASQTFHVGAYEVPPTGTTVTPGASSARASTATPSVVLGAASVTATSSAVAKTVSPSVTLGSLTITPSAASARASAPNPVVLLSLSVTPGSVVAETIAPTVIRGSVMISPVRAPVAARTIDPSVSASSASVISGLVASALASSVSPGVVLGSVSVTATSSAVAKTVSPSVTLGPLVVTPSAASAHASSTGAEIRFVVYPSAALAVAKTVDPGLVLGSVSIAAGTASAVAKTVDPDVQLGGVVVTDGVASAVAVTPSVPVSLGSLALTNLLASVFAKTLPPQMSLGSVAVTVQPVKALALAPPPNIDVSGEGQQDLGLYRVYEPATWEQVGRIIVLADYDRSAITDFDLVPIGLGVDNLWKKVGGPAS